MKRCTKCGKRRQLKFFSKKNGDFDTQCKSCRSKYGAAWYKRNRKDRIKAVAANVKAWRARTKEWIDKLKNVPCADCGGRFPPCVMDFDHIENNKEFNVGSAASIHGVSEKRLREEIAKCEVVCANCHRIRTFNRRHGTVAHLEERSLDKREAGGS